MKLILIVSLVLICSIIYGESAQQCIDSQFGKLELGKNTVPDLCGYVTCNENGLTVVTRCPAILVHPDSIFVPEDLSKPYPECCEKAIKKSDLNKN